MNHIGNYAPGSVQKLDVQGTIVLWSCSGPGAFTDGPECRKQEKLRLLQAMLIRENLCSSNLVYNRLGKPMLVINNTPGPSISFSHCNGIIWAAMTNSETDVGIDAERAEEFGADYPFHRAFQINELDNDFAPLIERTDSNHSECAALIWSAKEAFVKAIGCAFHLFSPLEVHIAPLDLRSDRTLFLAGLSDRGQKRLNRDQGRQMEINSFRINGTWVSIAAADRKTKSSA